MLSDIQLEAGYQTLHKLTLTNIWYDSETHKWEKHPFLQAIIQIKPLKSFPTW